MGSRKRPPSSGPCDSRRSSLQWGRDDGVAEEMLWTFGCFWSEELQWGRDDGVAEEAIDTYGVVAMLVSFNGAATMGSRKRTRPAMR